LRCTAFEMDLLTSGLSDYHIDTLLAISLLSCEQNNKSNTILSTVKWQDVCHALTKGKSTTDAV
jgi:hypothetical protein